MSVSYITLKEMQRNLTHMPNTLPTSYKIGKQCLPRFKGNTTLAKYFGKAKTGFQIALVATVANLMLAAAVSGAASSAAGPLAALVAIASLAFHCLATQKGLLEMAPSRPDL